MRGNGDAEPLFRGERRQGEGEELKVSWDQLGAGGLAVGRDASNGK